MPLSAEELVNALHEAAAGKNVDNFVAVAGVLEDQVDETFVQQKKGQLRRVIKLYRQIQKEQDSTPREIARAMEALGKKVMKGKPDRTLRASSGATEVASEGSVPRAWLRTTVVFAGPSSSSSPL